jgi:hypothetical protein
MDGRPGASGDVIPVSLGASAPWGVLGGVELGAPRWAGHGVEAVIATGHAVAALQPGTPIIAIIIIIIIII